MGKTRIRITRMTALIIANIHNKELKSVSIILETLEMICTTAMSSECEQYKVEENSFTQKQVRSIN